MILELALFYLGVYASSSRLVTHFYSSWHDWIFTSRFEHSQSRINIDNHNSLNNPLALIFLTLHLNDIKLYLYTTIIQSIPNYPLSHHKHPPTLTNTQQSKGNHFKIYLEDQYLWNCYHFLFIVGALEVLLIGLIGRVRAVLKDLGES
jgi:hypothetical protein